jgi:KDO2-lipid IV(A) lauroyltransferase
MSANRKVNGRWMNRTDPNGSKPYFDYYPAPVERVTAYTRKYSKAPEVKGNLLTKIFLQLLVSGAMRLSWKMAYRLGGFIGLLLYRFRLRREVAMINLDIVYGRAKTKQEKEAIYKASLINLGRVIVNYLRLPFMGESFWRHNCEWKTEGRLKELMNRKKGALLLSGHIGMMDLAGGKLGLCGYPVAVVGKRIKNPAIDQFTIETRNALNLGTIAHRDSMGRILEGIRRGEAVAMALDQNMKTEQGVFIDWMGHTASSVRSAAYVARETGAPVLAGYMYQKGIDRFEVVATEEVTWEPLPDDPEEELRVNTQKQSNVIQKIIYDRPELWFWIHQRYRRQPEGVPNPYAHLESRKKKKKKRRKRKNRKAQHENTKDRKHASI